MIVVPYVASLHAESMRAWKSGHHQTFYEYDLPKNGFVVPDVAAAWMMCTDTKGAYIDSFFSNPSARVGDKLAAITALMAAMHSRAGKLGYQYLCGYTDERAIKRVAERHGAVSMPHHYTFVTRRTYVG